MLATTTTPPFAAVVFVVDDEDEDDTPRCLLAAPPPPPAMLLVVAPCPIDFRTDALSFSVRMPHSLLGRPARDAPSPEEDRVRTKPRSCRIYTSDR